MSRILEAANRMVWGMPALVLILGIGLYLSVRTGFVQIRLFPAAWRFFTGQLRHNKGDGEGTPFRSLCTALAATVGTGNLAGVAGAIALGGPGAVFWIWVSGLLGMIIKFAEAVLAVRYRIRSSDGEYIGGPMYVIYNGLGPKGKWLGMLYSFFGVVAAFGVGNATQVNAVIGGFQSVMEVFGLRCGKKWELLVGVVLAALICVILYGGAKRIGAAAERLVPFAACMYILLGLALIGMRIEHLPQAFAAILRGAFTPEAVTGGSIGSGFLALRTGISRGVFTNEAGMGTAGIAHAGARVEHPAQQGLMGMVEVFLDTIVICTITALAILCSGINIPWGTDPGICLTNAAFVIAFGGWVTVPISICLCCFAFATMVGWGLYGARCAEYLLGGSNWKSFALLQGVTVVVSTMLKTGTVWLIAETVNGLMAIPNLIALLFLSPQVLSMLRRYEEGAHLKMRSRKFIHPLKLRNRRQDQYG